MLEHPAVPLFSTSAFCDRKRYVIKNKKAWRFFDHAENIMVFDCDGHIIESIPEMVRFLDPVDRDVAVSPSQAVDGKMRREGSLPAFYC
jgi:hypothetical protein